MKFYSTVEKAVKLAVDILEINHIMDSTENIRARVYSWYENSDVTDPEVLAACALMGIKWFPEATYETMINAKEYWFPTEPYYYNETSIWDIEAAQQDILWR